MARRLAASIVVLLASGCQAPPPRALLERLPAAAPPTVFWRRQGWVTIESEALGGRFRAALVAAVGEHPCVRLQLFPALGGKVLDLVATPERIAGYFPQARIGIDHRAGAGPLPRHLLVFAGLTLLEIHRPISAARILSARAAGTGWSIVLSPVVESAGVTATLDRGGRIIERHYDLRGASWTERWPRDGRLEIDAEAFRIEADLELAERDDQPPPGIFDLKLPPEIAAVEAE